MPRNLSLDEHRNIDDTTRAVLQSSSGSLVIEGTFLDALLRDIENVYRVELVCEVQERQRRFAEREGQDELARRDRDDEQLRSALHGDHVSKADLVVDTTSKNPDQVAEEIIVWLQRHSGEEHD